MSYLLPVCHFKPSLNNRTILYLNTKRAGISQHQHASVSVIDSDIVTQGDLSLPNIQYLSVTPHMYQEISELNPDTAVDIPPNMHCCVDGRGKIP